jgi:hypothetical protein
MALWAEYQHLVASPHKMLCQEERHKTDISAFVRFQPERESIKALLYEKINNITKIPNSILINKFPYTKGFCTYSTVYRSINIVNNSNIIANIIINMFSLIYLKFSFSFLNPHS